MFQVISKSHCEYKFRDIFKMYKRKIKKFEEDGKYFNLTNLTTERAQNMYANL